MTEIRLIDNPADLQLAARLRYAVYVEELGATMKHADHVAKELYEPWDETGDNIGAWINGELGGSIRLNCAGETDLSEYRAFFDSSFLQAGCSVESVSVSSKLTVRRRYRGTRLARLLAQACYTQMQERRSRLNFITCQPHLADMYRALGFQDCAEPLFHYEAGWVLPMVLVVQDQEYLREIHSPFAEICARYPIDEPQLRQLKTIYAEPQCA